MCENTDTRESDLIIETVLMNLSIDCRPVAQTAENFSPLFPKSPYRSVSEIPSTKKDTHFERFLLIFARFSPCNFSVILSINS